MKKSEIFWEATREELRNGYTFDQNFFICIICGEKTEKGIIYSQAGVLCDAEKSMRIHIEHAHGSMFEYLLNLDKRYTGLTSHYQSLLGLFYAGKSDDEIQKELGIASLSTIRNHRLALRDKERQAKVFSVLMKLLDEKNNKATGEYKCLIMSDDTTEISEEILKKFFQDGQGLTLKASGLKEKHRIPVLKEIARRFESGRSYSEKEVNEILEAVYNDFVTLRRYLVDYGFLERTPDGGSYWLKDESGFIKEKEMDRKKELKLQYKEMKTEGGIYQIKNTVNGKVFVVATPNFKTMTGRRFEVFPGGHRSASLQEDLKKYGEEAFTFEILEKLDEEKEGFTDKSFELKKLEQKWLEKLQPYGDKGYNKKKEE